MQLGTGLGVFALDRRHIERRRQEIDHRIEQRLDTLVLEGGAVENRDELAGKGSLADSSLDLVFADLLIFEDLHHQFFIEVGGNIEKFGPVELGIVDQIGRNVDLVPAGPEILAVPHEGLHLHEVNDSLVVAFGPDRKLHDCNFFGETLLDGVEHEIEISAGSVHLVDEAHTGHVVTVGLTPNGFGLRLNACNPVEHGNRAIEHSQGTFDLNGEVDVARSVDDVDAVIVPDAVGGSGGDGDATLLLLLHPVHRGCAVVDLADLVGTTGVVEDAFSGGGLARVDVGHDPDIAGSLEGVALLSHVAFLGLRPTGALHDRLLWRTHHDRAQCPVGDVCRCRLASARRAGLLPAVVSERLVGVGHLLKIFATLHRAADAVAGIEDLVGQTLGHGALATVA